MINSLLHFNDPNNLAKDEYKELVWQIEGVTSDSDGKFGSAIDLTAGKRLISDKKWSIIQLGDFTIDFWVKPHSDTSSGRFISTRSSNVYADAVEFFLSSSDKVSVQVAFNEDGNVWIFDETTGNAPLSRDIWHHVAFVRCENTFYFFVDGQVVWNETHSGSLYVKSDFNHNITLGGYYSQASVSLDEFRISDKAAWTSNFTPPTHQYRVNKYIYIDKNNTVMGMKE